MKVVGELPLSSLGDLLLYAGEKEFEKAAYPLWLAHFLFSQVTNQPHIEYGDMINQMRNKVDSAFDKKPKRTSEDIQKDFDLIVEQYRSSQKGG